MCFSNNSLAIFFAWAGSSFKPVCLIDTSILFNASIFLRCSFSDVPPCIRVAKDALDATILRLCATFLRHCLGTVIAAVQAFDGGAGGGGVMACTNSLPMAVSAVVLKLTRRGCCGSNIIMLLESKLDQQHSYFCYAVRYCDRYTCISCRLRYGAITWYASG